MMIINSLVVGVTLGGTILIAQYVGAKMDGDIRETIGSMLTLFIIAGLVLTAVMFAMLEPILGWLKTPEEALDQARQYSQVAFCGILFTLMYNGISAVLRGMGDSTRPLIFIAVACILNIGLDLIFVGPLGMGAWGAALATILSQGVSMVLSVIYLKRQDFRFDFKPKSFRLHRGKTLRILKLGLPISLQESMVNLSFLIISAAVNALGVAASAAVGIAGKFDGFAMLPATALSGAISSMAAQNMGAGQSERARKTMYTGIAFSLAAATLFFLWVQPRAGIGDGTVRR